MRGRFIRRAGSSWWLVLALLLGGSCPVFGVEGEGSAGCHPPDIHGGYLFPMEALKAEDRCRLERMVREAATVGVVGPRSLPVTPALYRYLLDHPEVTAALARHLAIAPYTITKEAPGRYWVDDGRGAQGRLDVLHTDETTGIYWLKGFYEKGWLPRITGELAFFLRFQPADSDEASPGMETVLTSYVRLDRAMLQWMLKMLNPLLEPAVTHRVSHVFRAAETLGTRLMANPASIAHELPNVRTIGPDERRQLEVLLDQISQVAHVSVPVSVTP